MLAKDLSRIGQVRETLLVVRQVQDYRNELSRRRAVDLFRYWYDREGEPCFRRKESGDYDKTGNAKIDSILKKTQSVSQSQ